MQPARAQSEHRVKELLHLVKKQSEMLHLQAEVIKRLEQDLRSRLA
jgi:hypothetical protein